MTVFATEAEVGAFVGLAGALLLAIGLAWLARNLLRWRAYSETVEGTITGFTEPDSEGNTYPLIGFVYGDRRIEVRGVATPFHRRGRTVAMRFPPGRPDKAVIADFANQYLFPLAVIIAAGLMVLMAHTLSTQTGDPSPDRLP